MKTDILKTELLKYDSVSIQKAATFLKNDEVVALPTETVYGLAGNAFSTKAVSKIFLAKERPSFDPLIVHVGLMTLKASESFLLALVESEIVSSEVLNWSSKELIEATLKNFWPGPLSIVLPRGKKVPDAVTACHDTVAIRCPDHAVFQSVLNELSFPLAAPSANRFGRISPTEAKHVQDELTGKIAAIVDGGACSVGVESTIIRIEEPLKITVLRPGQISTQELSDQFGAPVRVSSALGQKNYTLIAPGMLDQHYAPRKPLFLLPHSFFEIEQTIQFLRNHNFHGKIAFLGCQGVPDEFKPAWTEKTLVLSNQNSLEEMAHHLFSSLRALDEDSTVDFILADVPNQSDSGLRAAIVDRLNRASQNKPFQL